MRKEISGEQLAVSSQAFCSSACLQFHGNSWKKVLKWISFVNAALYGALDILDSLF